MPSGGEHHFFIKILVRALATHLDFKKMMRGAQAPEASGRLFLISFCYFFLIKQEKVNEEGEIFSSL